MLLIEAATDVVARKDEGGPNGRNGGSMDLGPEEAVCQPKYNHERLVSCSLSLTELTSRLWKTLTHAEAVVEP